MIPRVQHRVQLLTPVEAKHTLAFVEQRPGKHLLLRILDVAVPMGGGLLLWTTPDWFFLAMILWAVVGSLLLRSWWALASAPGVFAIGVALGAVLLPLVQTDWSALPAWMAVQVEAKAPLMSSLRIWIRGVIAALVLLGIPVLGSLLLCAYRLVDALSNPWGSLDLGAFGIQLPPAGALPPLSQRRPLVFQAADGIVLHGEFWAQPHRAPTIVFCHGYRFSSDFLHSTAALTYPRGYNVLLFDFRGHGQSERVTISGGHAEVRDLQAAIKAARRQPETLPGAIIIHGFSMGAAVALLTPPDPEVAAIIADSSYARLDEVLRHFMTGALTLEGTWWSSLFHRLHGIVPVVSWAIVTACSFVFRVRFGYYPCERPDMSFQRWREHPISHPQSCRPPILLIHGEQDRLVPLAQARALEIQARTFQVALETYYVKDADHCGAYGHDPQRYLQVVQQFLTRHLDQEILRGLVA